VMNYYCLQDFNPGYWGYIGVASPAKPWYNSTDRPANYQL